MKPHQKKWYGSLFVITFLIVATAMLLQNYGSRDLVGMAIINPNNTIYLTVSANEIEFKRGDIFVGDGTGAYDSRYYYAYAASGQQIVYNPTNTEFWFDSNNDKIVTKNELYTESQITDSSINYITVGNDFVVISKEPKTINDKSGQIFIYDKDNQVSGVYNLVKVNGVTYFATQEGEKTVLFDMDGNKYIEEEGVIVAQEGEKSTVLTQEIITALLNEETVISVAATPIGLKSEGQASKEARTKELAATAKEIGTTPENLYGEETAINTYLDLSDSTEGVTYDVTTGHYTGTMEYGGAEYDVKYHNDDMGITTTVQNQKGESVPATIYKDTSSIPPTYYTLGDKGQKVSYKPDETTKSNIRKAEHAVEDVEEDIQQEMQKCEKAKSDADCQLTYIAEDGDTVRLDATARQEAFMNRMYEEQEAKVQGLIAGFLNEKIDELLGGWSRGVPAGICAYIFGLEYYKQDGWTRVPMNASVDQLQSTLIANSRTVIIEGEKEEITEEMFRYAYTIKLLANQSVEWQTYLYNSCTAETSVDTFYDYGSLLAGGYFAFHYAGAGAQDMIFECDQEICLYDQACVVFADGSAPTCVSLVHGAGFETPVAGNDYDCAITG